MHINHRSKNYIGRVIDGYLDDRNGQFYAHTEENVLASLNAETGNIVWRQVLEKNERGKVQLLTAIVDESNDQTSTEVRRRLDDNSILFTISGVGFILGRGWNLRTGNLAYEWTLTQGNAQSNQQNEVHWFYDQLTVYSVSPTWGSRLEVIGYNVRTGYQESTKEITISGVQAKDCEFIKSFLICQTGGQVQVVNLRSGEKNTLVSNTKYQLIKVRKNTDGIFYFNINCVVFVQGTEPLVVVDNKIHNLKTKESFSVPVQGDVLSYIKKNNRKVLLQATVEKSVSLGVILF